jgi:GT2 family glycosyltransferase
MNKTVAFIIPTFNRKHLLEILLEQISNQVVGTGTKIITIVVNDGSADGTSEMLNTRFPGIKQITGDGNWWFTRCLNEGGRAALGSGVDFIITMNDDTEIRADFVETFLRYSEQMDHQALMGAISFPVSSPGKVTFSGVRKIIRWRLKQYPYFSRFDIVNPDELQGLHPTCSLMTRGMFIPKQIAVDLNLFDPRFPQYGSDEDFCFRAISKGYPAFICWDARVFVHDELTSKGSAFLQQKFPVFLGSFFNKYSVNSISKTLRFYWRHGVKVLTPVFFLIFITGTFRAYLWKYRKLKK